VGLGPGICLFIFLFYLFIIFLFFIYDLLFTYFFICLFSPVPAFALALAR